MYVCNLLSRKMAFKWFLWFLNNQYLLIKAIKKWNLQSSGRWSRNTALPISTYIHCPKTTFVSDWSESVSKTTDTTLRILVLFQSLCGKKETDFTGKQSKLKFGIYNMEPRYNKGASPYRLFCFSVFYLSSSFWGRIT